MEALQNVDGSVADDSVGKYLEEFRRALSSIQRIDALRLIQSNLEVVIDQKKEEISYCLIRETTSFIEGNPEENAILDCLATAGHKTSILAAVRVLQDISSSSLDSLSALELSLSLLRNALLTRPKDIDDARAWLTMFSEGNMHESLDRWVNLFLHLPGLVANACKRLNVAFPVWSVQGKYLSRITECAVSLHLLVLDLPRNPTTKCWLRLSHQYLLLLVKNTLRRGGEEIARGLYQVYERFKPRPGFYDVISDLLSNLSPKEFATLSRSMILHIISVSSIRILSHEGTRFSNPWLDETLRKVVSFSNLHAEAFVQSLIFSAGYSEDGNRVVAYITASTLANIDSRSKDSCLGVSSDSDDEDDTLTKSHFSADSLLRRHLIAVADRWSRSTYVLEAPNRQQAHVTSFIKAGMHLLCESKEDSASELVAAILEGVTCRLSSTDPEIRRDGMQVAVLLAHRLGEKLEFDELHEWEDKQASVEIIKSDEQGSASTSLKAAEKPQRFRFKVTDPDAPYMSDDDDSVMDDNSSSGSSWDDDNEEAPFDLVDDEDDLVDTAKPRFLSDCLDLMRTPETDENACSRHETALSELSRLVRSRPMDLSDVASTIAFELLHMENKFDINGFADFVAASLHSLAVEEPLLVGGTLIEEMFQDVSLADRLSAARALNEAAYELAGLVTCDKEGVSRYISTDNSNVLTLGKDENHEQVQDLRKVGLREISTRRWGHGSTRTPREYFRNSFTNVAPIWFYSLIRKFLERKEDARLWKGSVGSTFLATIFQTLAAFVECSRHGTGTSVLAKDLIQLVWDFNQADVGEVRTAVLLAVSISFNHLCTDDAFNLLLDGPVNMHETLRIMSSTDTDERCRKLALGLISNISKTVDSMSIRPLSHRKLF